jgi:cation:H+ antiporter
VSDLALLLGSMVLVVWSLILVVSLAVLIKGSDWFTVAAERIGLALGMPAFMVGVTIVAVGTSLPELVSSVLAVVRGAPEIVAGNVVGSNIANLLLVLGLAAIVDGHLRVRFELLNVDLPFLAGSAFFLALVLWDGLVSWPEAALCLAGLAIYLWYALRGKPAGIPAAVHEPAPMAWLAWLRTALILVASTGLIYLGADFTVRAVVEIAGLAGIGAEVIAASAIALGTSLPEVAVTITAARRGRTEIAVGNVLGSNVFNSFAVVGVSGLVGPLVVPDSITGFALPVMVIATVLAFFVIMEKEMTKWEGWLMILFYVYFLGALFNVM